MQQQQQPVGVYSQGVHQPQWQQTVPATQPGPGSEQMGAFQPAPGSTPGQRILAAAGLLSGQQQQQQQQSVPSGPAGTGAASDHVGIALGQGPPGGGMQGSDAAALFNVLQQRSAQAGFQGAPGADPMQHLSSPRLQPQQHGLGGSPPRGQFGELVSSQMSPAAGPSVSGGVGGVGSAGNPNSNSSQQRPKQRARRGQATDPHSIAERLRRERIAERMRALQDLVPNSNKLDKASMLDDIIEYVKFLQLQVKVLNLNRLSGPAADAVASLLAELDPNEAEKDCKGSLSSQELELTERQVALLMEQDMGMAMQYLQSKGLCLMPVSLANLMKGKKKVLEDQANAATGGGGPLHASAELAGEPQSFKGASQEGSLEYGQGGGEVSVLASDVAQEPQGVPGNVLVKSEGLSAQSDLEPAEQAAPRA